VLFYTGILMCLFAASIIITAITEGGATFGSRWENLRWTRPLLLIGCLVAFSFALDPLGLSFQLKLLWLAGYLPHVTSCVECGATAGSLVGFSARAGGAVCSDHGSGALRLASEGIAGIEQLLSTPLADAYAAELSERACRDALAVVTSLYEEHGGFRLRTLSA